MADTIANRATQMIRGTPDQDVMIMLLTAKIYIIDTSGSEQRVITRQERRTLLYRHLSQQYYEYIQQQWQWSQETMVAIAWNSREQAIKSLTPAMQTFVTKGSIGWLATNHKLHQWKETTVNTCHKCSKVETNDHLWMRHQRKTYREEVMGRLRTHLDEMITDPNIITDLLNSMDPFKFILPPREDGSPQDIIKQMAGGMEIGNCIGRQHILKGFLPSQWITQQDYYYGEQRRDPRTHNGEKWMKKLLVWIWKEYHALWCARNDEVHQNATNIIENRQWVDLADKANNIYEKLTLIRAADRHFFELPIGEVIKWPTRRLKGWVNLAQRLLEQAEIEHAARHGTQSIIRYMVPRA
jgi:hypothetical protein